MDARIAAADRLLRGGQVDEALDRLLALRDVPAARRVLGRAPAWRAEHADAGLTRAVDAAPVVAAPRVVWRADGFRVDVDWDEVGHGTILGGPLGVFAVARRGDTRAGELVALDAETGAPRWRRDLASFEQALLLVGDALVLHEPHGLSVLDAATGEARGLLADPDVRDVAALGEHLFFWTRGGLRRATVDEAGLTVDASWSHDDLRPGTLAAARGLLVVQSAGSASLEAVVRLVDPATGATRSEVTGSFVAGDDGLLVVDRGRAVVAEGGKRRPDWRLVGHHLLALGTAHVVTHHRRVGVVLRRAGALRLKLAARLARPAAAIARDVAYVSGEDALHALDAAGNVLWSLPAADLGGPVSERFGLRAWHRRLLVHTRPGRLVLLG